MNTGFAEFQTLSPSSSPQKDTPPPRSDESGITVDADEAPDSQNDANTQAGKQTAASAGPEQGLPRRPGSFKVLVADEDGNELKTSTASPEPDPSSKLARMLVFEMNPNGPQPPAREQIELQVKIEQVLLALRTVYPVGQPFAEAKFRLHFYSLFNAARWGLEGVVATDIAKREVNRIEAALIEEVAGPIKNAHLRSLALWGTVMSIPFAVTYLVLHLFSHNTLVEHLQLLGVNRNVLANFMLLWIGCFAGVCLSYALRTVVPSLADLTTTDEDYLRPRIRLLFAATLTMLLALLAIVGLVDIQIGTYALSQVASNATLAFVVGAMCGFSELALPDSVGTKAGNLIASTK